METKNIHCETWVDRYGDILFRYAMYRTSNRDVAEDLVQDTFMAALKSAPSFTSKSSEQTWLIGILRHKILDYFRHKMNKFNSQTDTSDDIDDAFNSRGEWRKQLEQWSHLPDNDLAKKEFAQILHQCLDKLPSNQREVFILRELDGFQTEEISKDCNLSSNNIWVLLHRARKKLRDCLEMNWFNTGSER